MTTKPRLLPLVMATCTCLSTSAQALQLVEARDGVSVEAIVSMKEPTRIRIENAKITDVFGNIYSSNCGLPTAVPAGAPSPMNPAINPTGEVALECDRDKGEIYVRPMGSSAKPINLFVSSANATYTLLLRRSDTPSDTIVIRDRTTRPMPADLSGTRSGPLSPSANHIRAMKALLVAMASDRVASDVRVEEVNRPIQLWTEARFSLMRTYEARQLVGEKYLLTNISNQVMVLAEQEFDRPEGGVIGVAIENLNLRPGDSTSVYVIRSGS
jgi:conjugal transfer pilus assembly protein TraK